MLLGFVIGAIFASAVAYIVHRLTLPGLIADAKADAAKAISNAESAAKKL